MKEESHDYLRDHGTVLTTDIGAEMIDQIYEDYQHQRTINFPHRSTAYNSNKAEKSTWLHLFSRNTPSKLPGINPGTDTNWPAPPRAAIIRYQPTKTEVTACPACGADLRAAPKVPRRPRPPPNSPALGYPADQPSSQQLNFSIPVGSSLTVNIAPSSYSSTMMDVQLLLQLSQMKVKIIHSPLQQHLRQCPGSSSL